MDVKAWYEVDADDVVAVVISYVFGKVRVDESSAAGSRVNDGNEQCTADMDSGEIYSRLSKIHSSSLFQKQRSKVLEFSPQLNA